MKAKRIVILLIAAGLISVVIAVGSLLYRLAMNYADFEADRFGFPYYWIEHVKATFTGRADYWSIETSNLALNIALFFLVSIAVLFLPISARNLSRTLCRHKGEVATVVAEGLEAPIATNYLTNLRNVASNPLVEIGLNIGKVIKYPFRPEICSLAPHLVDTAGQTPMSPQFEANPTVSGILNLARNPMTLGIAFGAAIATPFFVYGVYRIYDHYHKRALLSSGD